MRYRRDGGSPEQPTQTLGRSVRMMVGQGLRLAA